ncbi:MAG: chloride channel protein, partial [Planctomycetota bacterium]
MHRYSRSGELFMNLQAPMSKLKKLGQRLGFERDWYLIALGAIIGTLTAFGALAFAEVLHLLEYWVADQREAAGRWGWVTLFVFPLIGMGLTGVIVQLYASEAKGHGVPQVIKALVQRGGEIPARIGIVKVIASILTVGSGGSAGTEGPIVQIGATAGSVFGRSLRVDREHLRTLVGCGAAAGIAAIFNAPIAGVFFVLEILLRDFSLRTFMPIVISSVFASVTTQAVTGEPTAIFDASQLAEAQFLPQELPSYVVLGGVCGLVAVLFNRLLHWGEDVYDRVRIHPLLKPLTGALLLGSLGVAFIALSGVWQSEGRASVPDFYGNGYETIRSLLTSEPYGGGSIFAGDAALLGFLFALVAFKAVATTLTLASGGSGGVFAPSLFLGAATGGAVGLGLRELGLLPEGSSPAPYALVGMAAVVAGSTHAPLTAVLILFELTQNYRVILPIMLAAIMATIVARLMDRESIYTYRLLKAGLT